MVFPFWSFPELRPIDPDGRNPLWGNFRREGWEDPHIFGREYLQNACDSRDGSGYPVRVNFRFIDEARGLDVGYLNKLMEPLRPHLAEFGRLEDINQTKPKALVVEEFNTTGLTGVFDDSRASGNWAGFFHGEAKEDKQGGKMGRAGQGKITYHMVTNSHALVAVTVREDDSQKLMMGKCSVEKTHKVADQSYSYRAFWSEWGGVEKSQPLPFQDAAFIDEFCQAFLLERGGECGTSFVLPYPGAYVTKEALLRVVLEDFFFPILKGGLVVNVDGINVSKDSFFGLLDEYLVETGGGHNPPSKEFLSFIKRAIDQDKGSQLVAKKHWNGNGSISEDLFEQSELESSRQFFVDDDLVSIRLPVKVKKKNQGVEDSYVNIFLQQHGGIKKTEEAYIRSELYIANEKRLKNAFGKCFGLVLAEDEFLCDFLANAEEASHLIWNASEPKLTEQFDDVPRTLRIVRMSAPKLLELLRGQDGAEEENLLEDILPILDDGKKKKGHIAGGKGKKKGQKKKPTNPIKPSKQYYQIQDGHGVRVASGKDPIPDSMLPAAGTLRVAYDNILSAGNPFSKYHPLDFDLADTIKFPTKTQNVIVTSCDQNTVEFEITDQDFQLDLEGFDPSRQLRAKVRLEVD